MYVYVCTRSLSLPTKSDFVPYLAECTNMCNVVVVARHGSYGGNDTATKSTYIYIHTYV